MSYSLNLHTAKRRLLGLLLAWPLAGVAGGRDDIPLAGLQRWGSGQFRRFGFLVYDASLWVSGADPLRPPLALNLSYHWSIAGRDITVASVKEIRNLGLAESARLELWGKQMAALFPDVRPGDQLLGHYLPDAAEFYFNGRYIGRIEDPAFAHAFFAIWLDARTSAPELRAALLRSPAG